MKKKLIIPIIICLVIITGGIIYFLNNNRIVSSITLDINPSIIINLDKDNKVVNVKPLNNDAKDIISNKYNNKNLDEVFDLLITDIIDKGYNNDNNIDVILYTDGNIKNEDIANKIEFVFGKKDIHTEVIIIEEITKEDKELAKKYNISPAKASYIKSIKEDNEKVILEDLVNNSVSELKETKATGNYCNNGYILEGDWCLKEIEVTNAESGKVCPREYLEYEGICYLETPIVNTDKLYCREDFKLNGDKCNRTVSINAEPVKYTCPSGEAMTNYEAGLANKNDGIANDIVCVDATNAKHPVSPCETHDGTEYMVSGGVCYWHRAPVIAEGCPGKIQVNGECWDNASNIYICEGYNDGMTYTSRNEYCKQTIKYLEPTVTEYKCPSDYTLNGNKCLKEESEDAPHEQVCESGYTKVNNDRCINKSITIEKENGFVCSGENTRLKGNKCIKYEMIEANHYN